MTYPSESMRRVLIIVLAIAGVLGCGEKTEAPGTGGAIATPAEIDDFAERWKNATLEERQDMADLEKVGKLFLGATKDQIESVFGPPDQSGIDDWGNDVMRYELGTMPDLDGHAVHLAFEFQDGIVTVLTGNTISF
jgi:hypothetical protein